MKGRKQEWVVWLLPRLSKRAMLRPTARLTFQNARLWIDDAEPGSDR